jgi:hypothetical protein
LDCTSYLVSRDLHPLILQGGLNDNPTHRPVESGAPDGNRTHVSRIASGVLSQLNYGTSHKAVRCLALLCGCGSAPSAAPSARLGKDQMGKWCDRTEALHAGNRTRTAKAFATDGTPSILVEDNRSTSAHQRIGVTNRIRTGTNAFTGRDAAVTS